VAGMTERPPMNKPSRPVGRPLRDLLGAVVGDAFTRQGFASAELVTRWPEIAGSEVAAISEPIKIQWPRASPSLPSPASAGSAGWAQTPGTLVLRVEGPAAIEIQHLAQVICERVNRFLGWRAIERIAYRQAPLRRANRRPARKADAGAAARLAASLPQIADDDLRAAVARLGAAVKRS
jgi:hypothetical protein